MKVSPAAATVPLLLLLLTWLSINSINSDAELFDRALGTLDHFAMAESALHRDVLNARSGMLRNYDPLVREVNALRDLVGQLRTTEAVNPEAAAALDHLATEVDRQEGLVERFKSDNALLQNSLAYFGRISAYLGASSGDGPLVPAVSSLAASILRLTLDTSPETAREVEDRVNEVARQLPPSGDTEAVQGLLAHARLLRDLLPATDGVVKALCSSQNKQVRASIRAMILQRQAASRTKARSFRLSLYTTSLLLLGVLVHLGLRLRMRAIILRRRAAFEHTIAGISTRFINSRPQELDAHVQQALAELSACIGADRAYVVLSGAPQQMHAWCREGIAYPPGWPDRAMTLLAQFEGGDDGIVHVPSIDRMPPGPGKDVLTAAGIHSWACATRAAPSKDGARSVLGFDALRPGRLTQYGELGLLRMALDAIANAIGRQHLERERSRMESRLQQARRMETVGALASGIAHNFNNIVGAILGYAEMASEYARPGDRSAGVLEEIRRAGERARELVDQILTFARRGDARRKPMSIQSLIAETTSLLRASLPATVEIALCGAPDDAIVSGEPAQLQQVIMNLCNNAAQATGNLGRIEIESEVHELSQARSLSHGDLAPGRYVSLAVRDAGRGMSRATLERIFEPFFTTRVSGNGLGLATTREIVREHGGAMNVRSAAGAGACFEVWLPRIAVGMTAPGEDVSMLPVGHGRTILVVEDDRERLLRDEEVLAALGYEPVGFTGANDALAACRASPERFDILMVGRLASTTAALGLAATLHESAPDLPLLLATPGTDEIGADALMTAGISEVLHWPLGFAEVAGALSRCVKVSQASGGITVVTRFSNLEITR